MSLVGEGLRPSPYGKVFSRNPHPEFGLGTTAQFHHPHTYNTLTMPEKLNHYLKTWDLANPQLLAETATSHVYTVTSNGATAVLKLLTPIGSEERSGAVALRLFDGRGAVRLLRADDQAHLLEYAEGGDLVPLVQSGQDEKATEIIAGVLNQLHAAPLQSPPDGVIPLRRWFRSLFQRAERDTQKGPDSIYIQAARLAEALLSDQAEQVVLHGDIHHENIRYSAARGWLALDPKGLFGERTYDAANTLCNPLDMPEIVENEPRLLKNASILSQKLGIELPRILAFTFAYACLSASWFLEDGNLEGTCHDLKIAEIIEPHLHL
jgi:streptomycin 6-kinase